MPLPRSPRPTRHPGGSRSARRRIHVNAWIQAKLAERFSRLAELLEQKRQQDIANGTYCPPDDHDDQEKAPGLAAEG